MVFIGTAGWAIPKEQKENFLEGTSHLEKYGKRFNAVEINSSFYRPHRMSTYSRWADSVPEDFRFSVKMPKAITHLAKLKNCGTALNEFFFQVQGLGKKLAVVLIQLPPSLAIDYEAAAPFFSLIRSQFEIDLVLEARHASWFTDKASRFLEANKIGRVDADPKIPTGDSLVSPAQNLYYLRLHGAPEVYYSAYSEGRLFEFRDRVAPFVQLKKNVWCIFDNTAAGHALPNARAMQVVLGTTRTL